MSPIKGLTDRPRRLPRIGKIHLGVKVVNEAGKEYPRATDYFVFDPNHPQYNELVETFGAKTAELRIVLPIEDEDKFASQFYRLYSRSRGLVCKGDGETAVRMIDTQNGALANRDSTTVENRQTACQGRDCPDYGPRACGEVMNLQFLLPEVSGFGVWQIDTGSINSILNINNALELVRQVYGRVSMVPLILALEPKEVTNPDDGKKKTVRVLNIRSQDKMIEAYRKASMPALALVQGMAESGEIADDQATELPAAGDEPVHGDLPTVTESSPTAGPGTDSDPWPGGEEATPQLAVEKPKPQPCIVGPITTVLPDGKSHFPKNPRDGDMLVVKTTGEEWGFKEKEGWRQIGKQPPVTDTPATQEPEPEPTPETVTPEPDGINVQGGGEPTPTMTFADLLAYVKAHSKTESWLFKTSSMNVDEAKANPYECALGLKEIAGW